MLETIQEKIIQWFLGSGRFASFIRHGLSAAGGYLISVGLDPKVVEMATEPLANLIVGMVLLLFSYLTSRTNKKVIKNGLE